MIKLSQIIDTDAVYQAAVKQLREDKFTSYYDEATEVKTWPKWVSRINVPPAAPALPTGPRDVQFYVKHYTGQHVTGPR